MSPKFLLLLVAGSLAVAGCASTPKESTNNSTTTTTSSTSTTTSTTSTPTVTTPVLGVATSVTILSSPASGTAGGNATVCWRVEGTGKVLHTALHYDNASHNATNTTFDAYKAGASYPGNATSLDPAGYSLPGNFCANVPLGSPKVYLVAHVIDATGGKGKISQERTITSA